MPWFLDRWHSFQAALGRITGLSSLFKSLSRTFQRHKIYLRISLIGIAFLFGLWLIFFVASTVGQTFDSLKKIHPLLSWAFLLALIAAVVFVIRTIRALLRQAHEERKTEIAASFSSGAFATSESSDESATLAWLSSLPAPPSVSISDLISPGHRKLVLRLALAHDPQSYEEALAEIEKTGADADSDPAWLLARASLLIHVGRPLQAYPLLSDVQARFPHSPHAIDAKLLALATQIEFFHDLQGFAAQEERAEIVEAPPPSLRKGFENPLTPDRLEQPPPQSLQDPKPLALTLEDVQEPQSLAPRRLLEALQDEGQGAWAEDLRENPRPFRVSKKKLRLLDDEGEIAEDEESGLLGEPEEIDFPLAPIPEPLQEEIIPILGGILLEKAVELEAILSEVDSLREQGERQQARVLMEMILLQSPTSRYAKDVRMRLLGDQLFFSAPPPSLR